MASNPNSPPSDIPGVPDAVARVRTYHQRTKHLPGQFAPGPGYLDWANQPRGYTIDPKSDATRVIEVTRTRGRR